LFTTGDRRQWLCCKIFFKKFYFNTDPRVFFLNLAAETFLTFKKKYFNIKPRLKIKKNFLAAKHFKNL